MKMSYKLRFLLYLIHVLDSNVGILYVLQKSWFFKVFFIMTKQKKINDLDDSLSKLSKKLDNIRAKKDSEDDNNKNKKFTGFAHAFKVVSELFANILVGGSIGWTLDYFVNTKPIFLIIFLIIGFISGIYTSYKSSKKFAKYWRTYY